MRKTISFFSSSFFRLCSILNGIRTAPVVNECMIKILSLYESRLKCMPMANASTLSFVMKRFCSLRQSYVVSELCESKRSWQGIQFDGDIWELWEAHMRSTDSRKFRQCRFFVTMSQCCYGCMTMSPSRPFNFQGTCIVDSCLSLSYASLLQAIDTHLA